MTRGLRALVWKDLKRQFSDRKGVVVYLLVPLLLTFIMGLSFGGGIFGDTGISAIPLAISGGDLPSGLRDQLAQGLQESGFFQVTWTDSTAAADLVRTGDAKAALILSDRFLNRMLTGEKTTLKLWKDPDSAIKAGIVESILSGFVKQLQAGEAAHRALWPDDDPSALSDTDGPLADILSGDPVRMIEGMRSDDSGARDELLDQLERSVVFGRTVSEPVLDLEVHDRQDWEAASGDARQSRNLYDYFLPSFAVFFMMFGTAAIVRDLHRERENRTLARLLCGPTVVGTIVLGKWITAVVMATMQVMVLLICGGVLFGLNIASAPAALVLVSVCAGAAAASVYMVLGLLVRTEKTMDALTTIVTLVSGMLGGNFFPLDLMPPAMHLVSRGTFNYWANRAFSDIITRGEGFVAVVPEILAMSVIAMVGLVVAVSVFRLRQRKGVAA